MTVYQGTLERHLIIKPIDDYAMHYAASPIERHLGLLPKGTTTSRIWTANPSTIGQPAQPPEPQSQFMFVVLFTK